MAAEHLESDALGEIRVPDDCYYGAQTQRAIQNFPISFRALPAEVIHALGWIKWAAAQAHRELGELPPDLAQAIETGAREVAQGQWDDQFPVDVFQTGSGTSSNMNANEVIAKRANELLTGKRQPKSPVHPNDHVNRGQSSNDVFPTAIHLAAGLALGKNLEPALAELQAAFEAKAQDFMTVIKIGRTHLQDATPIRLGQEFSGYARMIERGRQRVAEARELLREVPLGATAVGTGLNRHPQLPARMMAALEPATGFRLVAAPNYFEALGSRHGLVSSSGALKTLATDCLKMANDLRLLASGPRCGLAEIHLPDLQPGSSIMPGKVNPVIPECVCQVAAQVIGNDVAVTIAGQSGLLELNVMMPLLAANFIDSIHLLANAARLLARRCVAGIEARAQRCRSWVEDSLALATALVPALGYDAAAKLAQLAYAEGITIREAARRTTHLSTAELDRLLDPEQMAG